MIVEIWSDNIEVEVNMPIGIDKVRQLEDLFDSCYWDVLIDFNGGGTYPGGIVEAENVARFLEEHDIDGSRPSCLQDMIEDWAQDKELNLSEAIVDYENKKIPNDYLKDYGVEYE